MAINDSSNLLFRIKADASQAKAEIDKITKDVNSAAKDMLSSFNGLVGPLLGINLGLKDLHVVMNGVVEVSSYVIKTTLDWTAGMYELGIKTNLTSESLYALKIAASESDVNMRTVGQGMVILQKNMVAAREDGSALGKVFKELGVDASGSTDDALKVLVKRFSEMEDGAAKTELAVKMFGARGGAEFLKLVEQMGGSMEQTERKYKQFGLTLSHDVDKQVDTLTDSFRDLELRMKGAVVQIGVGLLPSLTQLTQKLNDATNGVFKLLGGVEKLQNVGEIVINVSLKMGGQLLLGPSAGGAGFWTGLVFDKLAEYGKDTLYDQPAGPVVKGKYNADYLASLLGKDKKGKSGPKDLDENKLRIKMLDEESKDAQRIYEEETQSLKDQLDERLVAVQDWADKQIALEKTRAAWKLALLKEEEEQAKNIELPNKRAEELLKIQEKEQKVRQDFNRKLHEINQEQIKFEGQDSAQEAADKKRAFDEDKQLEAEHRDFIIRTYREEADAYKKRAEIIQQFNATFYSRRDQAIKAVTAIEIGALEEEYDRQKQDAERQLDELSKNLELRYLYEEEYLGRQRAINNRLIALEAEKEARIRQIQRQAQIERERNQPNSNLNVLGPAISEAITKIEVENAVIGQNTSFIDKLSAALDGLVNQLKNELPSGLQLAVQAFEGLAAAGSKAISGFLTGQQTLRQAVGGIVEALLAPYKKYAEIKAEIAFAEAAISFAYGNFASGAKFLAAGVAWTAVAGLIGAAGSLIGGSGASAASSVGANSSSSANNNNGPRIFNQDTKPAQVQIIVRPEPGTIVEHVVDNYRNNGEVRRIFGGTNR
jgi:hypothetical protein